MVRKPYEYTSMKSLNEPKRSFWGSLASKAKALLDDEDPPPQSPTTTIDHHNTPSSTTASSGTKVVLRWFRKPFYYSVLIKVENMLQEAGRKTENPSLQRSLDAITSSFNYIGTAVEVRFLVLLRDMCNLLHCAECEFFFRRVLLLWRRVLQGSFKKHVRRLRKSRTPLRYKRIWRFNSRLLAT